MTEKGELCPSKHIGPDECPDCHDRTVRAGDGDDYCDNCQATSSDYFTHFAAAGEYLSAIGFAEKVEGGIDRFLVLENRDASGVTWDKATAKRMLAEAEIPDDKMEQTVFEACAVAYKKENELLFEPRVREWERAEGAAQAAVERQWAESAGVPPEDLEEAFPDPNGRW